MNRPWSDWMFRLFKNTNAKKQGRQVRRPQFAVEYLEDRSVPAAGITVIAGASGSGDLDDELLAGGDVTAAEVTAATLGTISDGALEAVAANTDISVTSPGGITFDDLLASPIALQTGAAFTAMFVAQAGDIAFEQQSDSLTTAGGGINLTATNGLTLGGLTSAGGNINLTANVMDLGAAINAGTGRVTLQQSTAGRTIDLGGADVAATTLGITNTELGQITASVVKVGNAATGDINITALISQTPGFNTLSLQSGTTITEMGAGQLVVDRLAVRSVNSVNLLNAANDVESVAASVTGTDIDFNLFDTDSILVDANIDGLTGITTTTTVDSDIVLQAGSLVSQTAGANLTTTELTLVGAAAYNLTNPGNNVAILAAAITGANRALSYTDADALTIGQTASAVSTAGITTNNGAVTVSTVNGDLTVVDAAAGADVVSGTASTSLTAGGTNNLLDIQANAGITATGVTLTADRMNINDTVDATNAPVTLRNSSAGRLINLGGADSATELGLDNTDLNNVTNATFIVVGRNDASASGTITVTAAVAPTGTNQLELVTGGAITDGGGSITETRLGLTAGAVIGAAGNPLDVSVSNLESFTPTGGTFISNTGTALTIGGVNATLNGVRTGQNSITLTNDDSITIGATAGEGISIGGVTGSITVSNTANNITVMAAVSNGGPGMVSISAEDDLTVNAPVSTGPGMITLRADNNDGGTGNFTSNSTGTVTTTGGDISISASTATDGDTVTVGGAVNAAGGGVTIATASDVVVNASVATTTANITVTADANNDGAGNYTSAATGSLMTTTGMITVRGNNITTGGMIASTGGGNILIDNNNSNNNGTINVNAPVMASGGNGMITVSSDDNVSITAVISTVGTGNIVATADADGDSDGNLSTSGAITAVNGNIVLTAEDDVMIGAAVSTTGTSGGNITITADPSPDDGNFSSNTPGTISTTVGTVSITAAANVTVGGTISVGGTGVLTIDADSNNGGVGDALIGAAVSTNNGNITITAQDTDITAAVTTGTMNQVFLFNRSNADTITLGTDTVNALGLTDADLDNVTTSILNIGAPTQTGDILLTNLISLAVARVGVLSLETTGAIVDMTAGEQIDLSVRDLALRAGTGIGSADDLDLSVTNLAARNTTAGNIVISNTGVATLTLARNIDGLSGVLQQAAGADLNISNAGMLSVDAVVNSSGGGDNDVTLTTTGASGGISNTANGVVQTNNGTGDLLLDASSSGSITIVDAPAVGTEVTADNTGGVTLLANDAVSIGASVTLQTDTGDIAITANATDPTGTSDVTLGMNSLITTAGNVVIIADEGNGVGGAITMANGSSITGTLNTTLTAARDITVTAISATQDITVTLTGNLGNIVDDGIDTSVLVAGDDILLTSGGRIGGASAITTADIESAAATPTANFLAMIDVNYTDDLVLTQIGAQGNIQIRRVGGGINTSDIVGEAGTLVGTGSQLTLVSTGGNFTVDDNFNFNGANNADLFFATTAGNNVVINPAASLVNDGATATTSLMASGSATASIQGPAADNTADINVANLRLFTTGGLVGTSALSPLEFNAETIGGFTNGRPNGITPAAGGNAFLTDTLNGVAIAQFNAGTGNVTLNSRGVIPLGLGAGSSIVAVSPNDNVAEVIGNIINLDTTAATATGTAGHIGLPATFVEVNATVLNAATNQSNVWISEVGTGATAGAAIGLVNIGATAGTTAFLRVANGGTITSEGTDPGVADVVAPIVNLSTVVGDTPAGGNFGTGTAGPLEIAATLLNSNLAGGGNMFVRNQTGALIVQRANTTAGDIGIEVVGAGAGLTLGNANSTGNVVLATGGTATLVAPGAITSAAPAGVTDVAALLLSASAGAGVGTSGIPLETAIAPVGLMAATLAAAGGTGGVFVNNNGDVTIGTVGGVNGATGTEVVVNNTGALTVSQPVSATTGAATLSASTALTTNTGGTVTATLGAVSLTGGTTLTTGDAVNAGMTATLAANGGALAVGGIVTANGVTGTATGAITTTAAINAGTGAASLTAGTSLMTGAAVNAGTTASLTSNNGALTVGGTVTSVGTATLASTGGGLTVNSAVNSTAGSASLTANANPVALNANVTGATGVTATATDAATAGQNLTVGTTAVISAGLNNNVMLRAGDDLTVNGTVTTSGTGVTTLAADFGSADPLGATLTVGTTAVINSATTAQIVGGDQADSFFVRPQLTPNGAVLNIEGNDPPAAPGDTLFVDVMGATGQVFTPGPMGSGTFTFTNRQSVTFTEIENVATATVTVAASIPNASETGSGAIGTSGQFTLMRVGDTSGMLTVNYTLTGTAANGVDYQTLTGMVTFAAGSATAVVGVAPLNDQVAEAAETVILTITPGAGYALGMTTSATVTIADFPPAPPAPPPAPLPAPPAPPVYTGATIFGGFLILFGPNGQPAAVVPVPPGTQVAFVNLTGDTNGDVLILLPTGLILLDGATGRLVALAADLTGDGRPEVVLFSPTTGAVQTVFTGTGQVIQLGS